MYLLGLSFAYCITYLILFFGISLFFNNSIPKPRYRSIFSIGLIVSLYYFVQIISGLISDPEWSNRILHTFGGGFLIVLVAFLATRDSETKINTFQFFVVGISVAALFGVANEIFEFFLQNQLGFMFAPSVNDTWLDLISNTIGSIFAVLLLVPFVKASDE